MEFDEKTNELKIRQVADDIGMANGIAIDHKKQIVFVADTILKLINIYKRDVKTNNLVFQRAIYTDYLVDNIKFDSATNKLYGGGFARAIDSIKFHPPTTKHIPGAYSFVIEIDVS
jgi:sugar lactone lactonase YvrE